MKKRTATKPMSQKRRKAPKQRLLEFVSEPTVAVRYGQSVTDPRDGLTLFGPVDHGMGNVTSLSLGIIGTPDGIALCKEWLARISKPVRNTQPDIARPFFPGFQEVFGVPMDPNPAVVPLDPSVLEQLYRFRDGHRRIGELAVHFVDAMEKFIAENERPVTLWIVMVPDALYQHAKPQSNSAKPSIASGSMADLDRHLTGFGFDDENTKEFARLRDLFNYEKDFHNQLKIRLLSKRLLTQIIREGTIRIPVGKHEKVLEKFMLHETAKAWNLSSAIYYKHGGMPWRLGAIREGVCYIGLTFKQDETNADARHACCAAQMFLGSGQGMVFRGRPGPYYNADSNEFHLDQDAAEELVTKVIESYKRENGGKAPKQLFIHGQTYFGDEEWAAFEKAAGTTTQVVGVRIRDELTFKLFRSKKYPVLRGTYYAYGKRKAFLWTRGFIPRIQSVMGLETPNPLSVEVIRGEESIHTVCSDVMALTKLNYNSCIFGDGKPITLKFADLVGNILTAGPNEDLEVLPFKYYI